MFLHFFVLTRIVTTMLLVSNLIRIPFVVQTEIFTYCFVATIT